MTKTLILVASGGAIGATLRFLWSVMLYRITGGPTEFPVAIIGANVIGSFLMGTFVVLAAQRGLTDLSPFVMVGLLGGFTTFSAFSLETITLVERGALGYAAVYVIASVALSLLALMAGLWIMREVLS
jgi:CrcB protein